MDTMARMSLCVFFSMVTCCVLCTKLTISPIQITVGGDNPTLHLNGSCSPPEGATSCYTITIGSKSFSGNETSMVQIAFNIDNNEPTIVDNELRQRLSVSGDILTSEILQFSLRDPTTADADIFYCKTQFVSGSAGRKEDTVKVTAIVSPTTSTTSTTATTTTSSTKASTTKTTESASTITNASGVSLGSEITIGIGLMMGRVIAQ